MSNKHRRHPTRVARRESSTFHPSGASTEAVSQGRSARLEHLLHTELQSLLRDEASDPELTGIVVVAVTLSPDAAHARIAYAVVASIDQEARVRGISSRALERATGFLRARLAEHLDLKKLPRLTFRFVGVSEATPAEPSSRGGAPWPRE